MADRDHLRRASAANADSFLACALLEDSSDDEEVVESSFETSGSDESDVEALESHIDVDREPSEDEESDNLNDRSESDDEEDEIEPVQRQRPTARGRGAGRRGRGRRGGGARRQIQEEVSDESDEWTEDWEGVEREEFSSRSGPSRILGGPIDAINFFSLFFSEAVWQLIVVNTNLNAAEKHVPGRSRTWSPVSVGEIKAFFGLIILMGYMRFPRIQDYWQRAIPILSCNLPDVMTLTRFWQILRFFHVCDPASELPIGHPRYDKLQKVRPLINLLEAAFISEYDCKRKITIDEAMIPYKGRIGYKQYMKDKPTKWGIKVFILAESSTGYVYKFEIYTGKKTVTAGEHGLSTQIVLDLMEGLEGKGHHLYTDNYYSSPTLFDLLWNKTIYCCGTVRSHRKDFPKSLKIGLPKKKDVKRGFYKYLCRNHMMACVWYDRRYVFFLSTAHVPRLPDGTVPTTLRRDGRHRVDVECPPLLEPYIENMRGVDRGDQITALYNVGRKCKKPWRRIAFWLLEAALLNAYIVEGHVDERHKSRSGKRDFRAFRLELAVDLIGGFSGRKKPGRKRQRKHLRLDTSLPHLPVAGHTRLQCVRCSEKTKRMKTRVRHEPCTRCTTCDVHLCVTPGRNCFEEYHTLDKL